MKRQSLIVCVLTLVFILIGSGETKATIKNINANLTEATVFLSGAELTHITPNLALSKGANEVVIKGLSTKVDLNSIRVSTTNGVVISSYYFKVDYLSTEKANSPKVKMLEDSLKIYQKQMDVLRIEQKINNELIEQLKAGVDKNISGSETGLNIGQLVQTVEQYRTHAKALELSRIALSEQYKNLKTKQTNLSLQINQERTKGNKYSGELTMSLIAPVATSSQFTVKYFTSQASWTPVYDINIESTSKPIKLATKANLHQTTGFDWESVKLTLSSSQPTGNKEKPEFNTWFLQEMVPTPKVIAAPSYQKSDNVGLENVLAGRVGGFGKSTIRIRGTSDSAAEKPLYIINGQPASEEEFSKIETSIVKNITVLKEPQATAIYGTRAANGVVMVETKSIFDMVARSDNALNMVYNIDIPYTVLGNGKVQSIDLQLTDVSAEYKFFSAPKLNTETYVVAEIADWHKLGLIGGAANITYAGTYLGETEINTASTDAKLSLTLGTDTRIAVKRERLTDFSSTRFLGSNIQNMFVYEIVVQNNHKTPVTIIIQEQYPISTLKSIEINLQKETTPWSNNDQTRGIITWENELKPGESRTYTISYSVKYPKDMKLNL